MDELHGQARAEAVHIAALCMGTNFNAPDKAAEIAWAVRAVQAAQALGAPAVRIDAVMSGEKDLPLEQRQQLVAEAVEQILAQPRIRALIWESKITAFRATIPILSRACWRASIRPGSA